MNLKDRILANITQAKAKGYTIVSGAYGYSNTCCPLNAACIVQGAGVTTDDHTLARFNEMEPWEVIGFIQGFDGDYTEFHNTYYRLGAELRAMLDRGEI